MHKYIITQLKRSVVHNALFCLLLALAGTLLCLGTGLLLTAVSSMREADDAFTTIALPDAASIRTYAAAAANEMTELTVAGNRYFNKNDTLFKFVATGYVESEINENITSKVYTSDEFDFDTRRVFGGYIPGATPYINADTFGPSARIGMFSPNATSAYIAVADDVRHTHYSAFDADIGMYAVEVLVASFAVEETLLAHPMYRMTKIGNATIETPPLESLEFVVDANAGGGAPMIEAGKRYFLFSRNFEGRATGYGIYTRFYHKASLLDFAPWYEIEPTQPERLFYSYDDFPGQDWVYFTGSNAADWPIQVYNRVGIVNPFDIDHLRFARSDTGYRWLIELPDDPNEPLSEALQSEIDEIIAMGEKSVNSFVVMTTNRLDSFFRFNQARARITEDRTFTKQEIESGARVAVISELTDGVEVGDTVSIELYETQAVRMRVARDGLFTTQFGVWGSTLPYSPVSLVTEPIEFEIIGKFYAPPGEESEQAILPNTIFIPDNSLSEFPYIYPEITEELQQALDENDTTYDEWLHMIDDANATVPILNTIIIPNGKNEEFADAINAILPEYAGFFRIYDQGYSDVKGALDNLLGGGRLIIVLCAVGWLVATLVFCLFYVLRKRKEAGLLYALGVKKSHRFRWIFVQCMVVVIISQIIAFGTASALYKGTVDFAVASAKSDTADYVAEFSDAVMAEDGEARDFAIAPDPHAIPIAVATQLIVLLLVTGVMSATIVKKGVVSLRAGGDA